MVDLDPPVSPPMTGFRCSVCARSFIAVDVRVGRNLLCSCGGAMLPRALARGLYELSAPEPCDSRLTMPEEQGPRAAPVAMEEDVGYGASHGYDATHGGPSGPGDAPAVTPAAEPASAPLRDPR